jgi:hypothetical protein
MPIVLKGEQRRTREKVSDDRSFVAYQNPYNRNPDSAVLDFVSIQCGKGASLTTGGIAPSVLL